MDFQLKNDGIYYEVNNDILAYAKFTKNFNKLTITKVFVDASLRGKGVASIIMNKLFEYSKENNLNIDATCSYAISWLEKNKERV